MSILSCEIIYLRFILIILVLRSSEILASLQIYSINMLRRYIETTKTFVSLPLKQIDHPVVYCIVCLFYFVPL